MQDMETTYEASMAQSESDAIELNATVLPMLIKASRHDAKNETKIALTGTAGFRGTYATHLANGTPWSLANANNCLDDVATIDTLQNIVMKITIADMALAPAFDPVALLKTSMNAYPVVVEIASSRLPRQKQKVISMTHPVSPLIVVVQIIDRATFLDASRSSSDM